MAFKKQYPNQLDAEVTIGNETNGLSIYAAITSTGKLSFYTSAGGNIANNFYQKVNIAVSNRKKNTVSGNIAVNGKSKYVSIPNSWFYVIFKYSANIEVTNKDTGYKYIAEKKDKAYIQHPLMHTAIPSKGYAVSKVEYLVAQPFHKTDDSNIKYAKGSYANLTNEQYDENLSQSLIDEVILNETNYLGFRYNNSELIQEGYEYTDDILSIDGSYNLSKNIPTNYSFKITNFTIDEICLCKWTSTFNTSYFNKMSKFKDNPLKNKEDLTGPFKLNNNTDLNNPTSYYFVDNEDCINTSIVNAKKIKEKEITYDDITYYNVDEEVSGLYGSDACFEVANIKNFNIKFRNSVYYGMTYGTEFLNKNAQAIGLFGQAGEDYPGFSSQYSAAHWCKYLIAPLKSKFFKSSVVSNINFMRRKDVETKYDGSSTYKLMFLCSYEIPTTHRLLFDAV